MEMPKTWLEDVKFLMDYLRIAPWEEKDLRRKLHGDLFRAMRIIMKTLENTCRHEENCNFCGDKHSCYDYHEKHGYPPHGLCGLYELKVHVKNQDLYPWPEEWRKRFEELQE